MPDKPLLFIDIDGVISLFDFGLDARPPGAFATIDGIPHFLSSAAGEHLLRLAERFEPVWCSGWEEKANEYLPHLLGLPGPWPFLSFGAAVGRANAHWKLDAIGAHAGPRPLAWIDDAFNEACREWAAARGAPTLLMRTEPATGLQAVHVQELVGWAGSLAGATGAAGDSGATGAAGDSGDSGATGAMGDGGAEPAGADTARVATSPRRGA